MTDVKKFLGTKHLVINKDGELSGGIPYEWDKVTAPQNKVSIKCIYATLGHYNFPFRVDVEIFWGFDDRSRLVDIWVRKEIDAL